MVVCATLLILFTQGVPLLLVTTNLCLHICAWGAVYFLLTRMVRCGPSCCDALNTIPATWARLVLFGWVALLCVFCVFFLSVTGGTFSYLLVFGYRTRTLWCCSAMKLPLVWPQGRLLYHVICGSSSLFYACTLSVSCFTCSFCESEWWWRMHGIRTYYYCHGMYEAWEIRLNEGQFLCFNRLNHPLCVYKKMHLKLDFLHLLHSRLYSIQFHSTYSIFQRGERSHHLFAYRSGLTKMIYLNHSSCTGACGRGALCLPCCLP